MRTKGIFLLSIYLILLFFLQGCAKTPQTEALGKVREAIQLLIQIGVPTEKAILLLEEGKKEIKDPFLEETLGLFYLAQQPSPNWEKAEPLLKESKTKFASIVLGEISMRIGEWKEALKYLKGGDPLSCLLSAYCYVKIGEMVKAREILQRCSMSKEKIPNPMIFTALAKAQPLPAVNLRYYSLKWLWDNLEKVGKEIEEKTGEREPIKELARSLIDYANIEPEYTACLSLLSFGVDEEWRKVVTKKKEEFIQQAKRLESETVGSLYRIIRLLSVIVIAGVLLVITGIVMSMVGLIKGRGHPLWRKGFITAGLGFGIWIVLMLLFHPLPAGGLVQGYIGRRFYNKQVELIKKHWQKLDIELESHQGG